MHTTSGHPPAGGSYVSRPVDCLKSARASCAGTPTAASDRCSANADFVDAVARQNVRGTVEAISEKSEVLRGLKDEGKIDIVGGMYDIETGGVEFF